MPQRKRPARPKPKVIRSQPRDPVTGQRRSIYAESEVELGARLHRLGEIRRDVRYGLDPNEASRAMRPALGTVLTVSEVWQRYSSSKKPRAQRKANKTWRCYIEPYLGGRRAWELSPDVMAHWVLDLGRTRGRTGHGLAPATVWLCYDYLQAAYNRLVPRELPGLPWGSWRPELPRGDDARVSRREYATSLEELRALVLAARGRDQRRWDGGKFSDLTSRVVVLLLTGLRQAELCGLAWDMVDVDGPPYLLHVWAQAPRGWRQDWPGYDRPPQIPKGRRRRRQVMHPDVIAALRAQREQLQARGWHHAEGPVFPGRAGQWRTNGEALKPELVRELAREAGLPNPHLWTTHSTRHTFATLEVAASLGDFKATQERTGHSSIAQLQTYYHAATGRGMPSSQIPEIGAGLVQPAIETAGREVTIDLRLGPDAPAVERELEPAPPKPRAPSPPQLPPAEPEPPQERGRPKAPPCDYAAAAAAWLEACGQGEVPVGKCGRPLVRPAEVTEDIRRAQRRTWARYRKQKLSAEDIQKHVAATRRAKLGAWTRALRLAAKRPPQEG